MFQQGDAVLNSTWRGVYHNLVNTVLPWGVVKIVYLDESSAETIRMAFTLNRDMLGAMVACELKVAGG